MTDKMFTYYVKRGNEWTKLPDKIQMWMLTADQMALDYQVAISFQEADCELDGIPLRYDVNADRSNIILSRVLVFVGTGEKAQVIRTQLNHPPMDP